MKHKTITTNLRYGVQKFNPPSMIDEKIAETSQQHDARVNTFLDSINGEVQIQTTSTYIDDGGGVFFTLVTVITY